MSPSPSPTQSAQDRALGAADRLLYSGDYKGAEAAYRRLAATDPHAQADLALLLTYEARYQAALATAESAVARLRDSLDLGVLARARDWAQDYDGALAAGGAAVAAAPVSPLARAFFSEALADAGLYSRSRAQLVQAGQAAGDPYTRSEVERDWANLYRDEGDTQQELNYFELSLRDQPRFPERTLELVRYFYGEGRTDRARALISSLRKGRRYWALEEAAEAAVYLGGDVSESAGLYRAALAVDRAAPEASLGLAELDVNVHDFQAAHDRLLPVLRAHPDAPGVYEFLRYLDVLVLKLEPGRDLAGLGQPGGASLTAARHDALARLNSYRAAAGVGSLPESAALSEAAQSHAYYVLFNRGASQLAGLGVHSETASLPGFTGTTGFARAQRAGFKGPRVSEVIDHVQVPFDAVETWADSVYHRYPLLDTSASAAGFGTARVGTFSVEVMDVGLRAPAGGPTVVYPGPGASGVPPDFPGSELPDPAPGAQYPIGYPITVAAGASSILDVTAAALTDASGRQLQVYSDRPGPSNPDLGRGQWAMLPTRPLAPGATYTADVRGTLDGRPFERRWSFSVLPL